MNMHDLINEALCLRLMLTLAHFAWQGAALGLGAGLVSLAFKRHSPALRHNLYLLLLCAMALCPLATFSILPNVPVPQAVSATAAQSVSTLPSESVPSLLPDAVASAPTELAQHASDASIATIPTEAASLPARTWRGALAHIDWRAYAPVFVLAYFAGTLALLARLLLGLAGGGRLRRGSSPVTDGALLSSLARGAELLGMRYAPALAFCERVGVPTVVGLVRPMVLLPLSIATGFTPQQVECLLLHELAHIRRRDHLVNLFQRIVEALLFYHPAVWFVSNRIRLEREHCCDDRVLACGGLAHEYAGALVTAAALCCAADRSLSAVPAALSATGRPGHLRARIERLLGGPGPSLRFGRGTWFMSLLFVFAMAAGLQVMASAPADSQPTAAETKTNAAPEVQDLVATSTDEPAQDDAAALQLSQASAQGPSEDEPKPAPPAATDPQPVEKTVRAPTFPPSKTLLPDFAALSPEVQELVEQLDDPDWWLRKLAVQQLSEKNDPHALALFIPKLTDSDKRVQAAAAEALGRTADPRAIKHLVAALKEGGAVCDAAAEAMTHFPVEKVLPLLRLAVKDSDPGVQMGALKALAKLDHPEVADLLASMLPSIMPIRTGLTGNLAQVLRLAFLSQNPERVLELLAAASASPDTPSRQGVAELLCPSRIGRRQGQGGIEYQFEFDQALASFYKNPRTTEILVRLSGDSEPAVRAPAVGALGAVADGQKENGQAVAAPILEALYKRLQDRYWFICKYAADMMEAAGWQAATPEERAWFALAQGEKQDFAQLGATAVDPMIHALQADKNQPFQLPGLGLSRLNSDFLGSVIQGLGALKDARAVPALLEVLNGKNEDLTGSATWALGQIGGPEAADALFAVWEHGRENVRVASLSALAGLKDKRALQPLMTLLSNESSSAAQQAASSLGTLGDPQAVPALITALSSDKVDGDVRVMAAHSLGLLKDPTAVDPLIKVLFSDNRLSSPTVIHALGQVGGPAAFQALVRALTMPDFQEVAVVEAVNALALMHNPDAVTPLSQLLIQLVPRVQGTDALLGSVVDALGTFGGPEATQALVDATLLTIGRYPIERLVSVLAKIAPPHSADALCRILSDARGRLNSQDTLTIVTALAELGDSRAEEPLTKLTASPETRVPAEEALKRLKEKVGAAPVTPPAVTPGA